MRFAVGTPLALLIASPARAQEACRMEMLKDAKLTLSGMFSKAESHAKAWKADAVPTARSPRDLVSRQERRPDRSR